MGPTQRYHWAREIEEKICPFYPSARAVVQDETTDFIGMPAAWVIVWIHVAGEDIESARKDLRTEGYWVSKISIMYEPAMA